MAIYETDRWRAYANALGFVKTEDAEKDYLQELLLYWLSSYNSKGILIFRGGTAISKLYGSGRFSEDLDFVLKEERDPESILGVVEKAIKGIKLQYDLEYSVERYKNMLKYVMKIKGPLYALTSNAQAVQTIRLDINTYERTMLDTVLLNRVAIYEDMKPYMLTTVSKEELLADKIKAMLERIEPVARDLYDAWILIKKHGLKPDLALVGRKMKLYGREENERFSKAELDNRIRQIGKVWDIELKRLIRVVPEYMQVSGEFLSSIR